MLLQAPSYNTEMVSRTETQTLAVSEVFINAICSTPASLSQTHSKHEVRSSSLRRGSRGEKEDAITYQESVASYICITYSRISSTPALEQKSTQVFYYEDPKLPKPPYTYMKHHSMKAQSSNKTICELYMCWSSDSLNSCFETFFYNETLYLLAFYNSLFEL